MDARVTHAQAIPKLALASGWKIGFTAIPQGLPRGLRNKKAGQLAGTVNTCSPTWLTFLHRHPRQKLRPCCPGIPPKVPFVIRGPVRHLLQWSAMSKMAVLMTRPRRSAQWASPCLRTLFPVRADNCAQYNYNYHLKHSAVILSYILQNSIQTVSILVVGRLGPNELSAAAFSLMFAMVTGE